MEFQGFTKEDFEVFEVPGFEPRMDALKRCLRPKLEQLGADMSVFLSDLLHQPIYPHVAKHARRRVNPPVDSWVAFSHDKRGYKKHPHFQIGAWRTHAFATFGLIYESPFRQAYAEELRQHLDEVVSNVPANFVWIPNHMDPHALPARDVTRERLLELANGLEHKRPGELLVGICVDREEAARMSAKVFEDKVKACFRKLTPLYRMSMKEVMA